MATVEELVAKLEEDSSNYEKIMQEDKSTLYVNVMKINCTPFQDNINALSELVSEQADIPEALLTRVREALQKAKIVIERIYSIRKEVHERSIGQFGIQDGVQIAEEFEKAEQDFNAGLISPQAFLAADEKIKMETEKRRKFAEEMRRYSSEMAVHNPERAALLKFFQTLSLPEQHRYLFERFGGVYDGSKTADASLNELFKLASKQCDNPSERFHPAFNSTVEGKSVPTSQVGVWAQKRKEAWQEVIAHLNEVLGAKFAAKIKPEWVSYSNDRYVKLNNKKLSQQDTAWFVQKAKKTNLIMEFAQHPVDAAKFMLLISTQSIINHQRRTAQQSARMRQAQAV